MYESLAPELDSLRPCERAVELIAPWDVTYLEASGTRSSVRVS
jgi:hypothetical protein